MKNLDCYCFGISLRADPAAANMGHTHVVMAECFDTDSECCETELMACGVFLGRKVVGWATPRSESEAMAILDRFL